MQDLFGDVPKPEVDALGYLIKFARKAKGRAFSSEEVTLSALGQGIAFEELRAWGAVFSTAARVSRRLQVMEIFSLEILPVAIRSPRPHRSVFSRPVSPRDRTSTTPRTASRV